jgi:NADH:ubiquinone oxidoreductase subunit E
VKSKLRPKPISAEVVALTAQHNNDPEVLVSMLQIIQAQHGGLTRAAIIDAARALGIPAQRAYGVATSYGRRAEGR